MNTLRKLLIMTATLALLALPAAADITQEPGYFDLEWIAIPEDAEEIQDIDLSAMLTEVAARAKEDGDDELAKALAMVRSVRVKAFSLEYRDKEVEATVERVNTQLKDGGWNRLIYVKDGDESVTVSSMHQDGLMVGLVAVVYEPGDSAAFINVVGDLDLATLLGLAGEFDLDELGEYMGEQGGDDEVEVERRVE
jgi:hypothetical protein